MSPTQVPLAMSEWAWGYRIDLERYLVRLGVPEN